MHRMHRMRRTRAAIVACAALIAGCDLGTVTIPKTASTIVVHGVLNPNFSSQVVLVERTLTGTITVPDTGFDSNDPIVSAGGIAVSGALVEIIDSTGLSIRGIEDFSLPGSNGKGAGVYRVPLGQVHLGTRYQLHVRTTSGEEVTAFTRVPNPLARSTGALTRTFNRDHDSMFIQWNAVPIARSYTVRIETPFGPYYLFTDSTRFGANGNLRNLFSTALDRVFIPGFHQDMVIAAVDSNFYDYYRTNNDPFTGAGIISRVNGGLGLFGSLVELTTGTITTVADQTEPIESRFRLVTNNPTTTNSYASQLTLYIESLPARDDLPTALSGRYTTPNPNSRSDGIIGQQIGTTVTLALLANQLVGDTLDVFIAQLRGDTLVGAYTKTGGTALFVKSP